MRRPEWGEIKLIGQVWKIASVTPTLSDHRMARWTSGKVIEQGIYSVFKVALLGLKFWMLATG
jgi:hypothetical protein